MIFNLASFIDWRVITTGKQRQAVFDNFRGNTRRVTHDYAIDNIIYVEMTGIYQKLYYKKQRPYIITKVFTNSTVQFQWERVNEHINIRRLTPNIVERADRCPYGP